MYREQALDQLNTSFRQGDPDDATIFGTPIAPDQTTLFEIVHIGCNRTAGPEKFLREFPLTERAAVVQYLKHTEFARQEPFCGYESVRTFHHCFGCAHQIN